MSRPLANPVTSRRAGPTTTSNERAGWRSLLVCLVVLASTLVLAPEAGASHRFERWAGADRHETAATIAREAFPDGAEVVYLASARSPFDALAATPAAGRAGAPILLTEADRLPAATAAALAGLDPSVVVVLGGPHAIADPVAEDAGAAAGATVRRLAGADRYATAAAVSVDAFADSVDQVILVGGERFADALAGGAAAAEIDGPVLLTPSTELAPAALAEIDRLRPRRVVVLGGVASVGQTVMDQLSHRGFPAVRIGGQDRYSTSAKVAGEFFPSRADAAVLASGADFPDALAGGAAAAKLGAPLVLVPRACQLAVVAAELDRLVAPRRIVLGGAAAVSEVAASGGSAIHGRALRSRARSRRCPNRTRTRAWPRR